MDLTDREHTLAYLTDDQRLRFMIFETIMKTNINFHPSHGDVAYDWITKTATKE